MTPVETTPDLALSAYGTARSTVSGNPLTADELRRTHAYWLACNYLALGMIYLVENPLLKEPLRPEHIKNRLLGHWGSSPGLAFIYTHLNRCIKKYDLDMIFLAGPGHGAPGVLGPCYLEGTYSEIYPQKSEDLAGMREFFKEFSFPGGIGSHCTPETPGSIHEGGELGYVLSHACGAAFDNPELIVSARTETATQLGKAEASAEAIKPYHCNRQMYYSNKLHGAEIVPEQEPAQEHRQIIERVKRRRKEADRCPQILVEIEKREFTPKERLQVMDIIGQMIGTVVILKEKIRVAPLHDG